MPFTYEQLTAYYTGVAALGWIIPLAALLRLRKHEEDSKELGFVAKAWGGAAAIGLGSAALAYAGLDVFGLFVALVGGVFYWGWLALLIVGFMRIRKPSVGLPLILCGLLVASAVAVWAYSYSNSYELSNAFNARKFQGPKGTIRTNAPNIDKLLAVYLPEDRLYIYSVRDTNSAIPAGEHRLDKIWFQVQDSEGRAERVTYSIDKGIRLTVSADSETTFKLPQPFTASIRVIKREGRTLTLACIITDALGNHWTTPRGSDPPIVVIDSHGKSVWQGEYADLPIQIKEGAYAAAIPDTVSGAVTLRPLLDREPFPIKIKDTTVEIK